MKKKVVAGLIAITALSMIVGGCGVNLHIGNDDRNSGLEESSDDSSSDEDESDIDEDEDSSKGIKFNTSMSLTFNVQTGDSIKVGVNGYKLGINKDNNGAFDIKSNDTIIATGIFLSSDMYDTYYGLITDEAIEIKDISYDDVSEAYFVEVDNDGNRQYCTMGWLNGSNTGFMVYAVDGDFYTAKDAVDSLTFEVESNSGDGVDKVALPDKVEGDAVYEDSSNSDEAVSNENASANVVVPDGFEVSYECEYFTDYDKGDITVRINHGDYDEEVNQFLKGNPDYLDAATLSDAGTYKMGDREVQAIKSDGHIDDMDTGYVKYYFVGDGVNASIYNRVNDELTVEDAEELVSEFYE